MRRKGRLWVAVGVIVAALTLLIAEGASHLNEYQYTLAQLPKVEPSIVGRTVKISGELVGRSVHYNVSANLLTFRLRGGGNTILVAYHGVQPDAFQQNITTIVTGTLNANGVFDATRVLVQCPSHYGPATSAQAKGS